jgi:riboflavin kinase
MHIHIIRGRVVTGIGEGRYYISQMGYRRQFSLKLGFEPYPGTLNVKLSEPFEGNDAAAVYIERFRDENRTFGACKCYPVIIEGIRGAIVRPERSSYPLDLAEVIAPVSLREVLGLCAGDEVLLAME